MKNKMYLVGAGLALFILSFPIEVWAQTGDPQATNAFARGEFVTQSNTIKNFLFGPAMRVVGIIGGAYGVINAILTSSPKPLMIYGG